MRSSKAMKSTSAECVRAKCKEAMAALDACERIDAASKFHGMKVVARVLLHVGDSGSIRDTSEGRRDFKKLKAIIAAFGVE